MNSIATDITEAHEICAKIANDLESILRGKWLGIGLLGNVQRAKKGLVGLSQEVEVMGRSADACERLWLVVKEIWYGEGCNDNGVDAAALEALFREFAEMSRSLSDGYETIRETDRLFSSWMIGTVLVRVPQWKRAASTLPRRQQQARELRDEIEECLREIEDDARERNIAVVAVIQEELDAKVKLREMNLSADEWREIAKRSGAPEYMRGESGGPCPF